MSDRATTPLATYRLQLSSAFTLSDAAPVLPYLNLLAVTDVYVSPVLTATRGASHGYHVTDASSINPELGGEEGLQQLARALDELGLGLVVDIVPNHMAANHENPWWWDVLQHGRESRYASWFDIDWEAGDGRVVLPVLGEDPEAVVAAGELEAVHEPDGAVLHYHDKRFPLAPGSVEQAGGDLRALLDRQHYRLAYWRTGTAEMNYRRFFDITELVGLRVEDPQVFAARHERLRRMVADGVATGVRVDHVDGLRDPGGYLADLQQLLAEAAGRSVYVVIEKIAEGDEPLPPGWATAGTTGYEFLAAVQSLQVDEAGLRALDDAYRTFTGIVQPVAEILPARKRAALDQLFPGEVDGLTTRLVELANAMGVDVDRETVRETLVAVTTAFPVYRAYVEHGALAPRDLRYLAEAFAHVRAGEYDPGVVDVLERILSLDLPADLTTELRSRWIDTVVRWQQLTGPAMAKGFEDTTFYVHNRLVSQNEVGMDVHTIEHPGGISDFHRRIAARAAGWPHAMNATSTHDTKRSEDVRARLNVLSEIPQQWQQTVAHWSQLAAPHRSRPDAPDRNEEWLLYQSLVGMWPLGTVDRADLRQRLQDFMHKAGREAKTNTSWLDPNEQHEDAVARFVADVIADDELLRDVAAFVDRIALPGAVNSLAQTLLKIAAPGVPDLYQGTEEWALTLVDPDNRRPVDFDSLAAAMQGLAAGAAPLDALLSEWRDGRIKQHVTARALAARRSRPDVFLDGDYVPVGARGVRAEHVVAFLRSRGGGAALCVAPRLPAMLSDGWPLGDVWEGTTIEVPDRGWTDVLTGRAVSGGEVPLDVVLSDLPVALLVTDGDGTV